MEGKKYTIDVFISYKHASLDIMVSDWLQKNIERYRIPRDIQAKSGKKKINRVFRDVEDLSVGNDLGKEIESQLQNSEFLIVVCSPEAKQSEWVNREIRTFLKYHEVDNILPIIIKGEPEEAFPNALLQCGEPFAADVRAADAKGVLAKLKTEYIRLVAPILYCSYDELVQRHRRYQYQRLLTISGIVVTGLSVFAGYALYQNYRTNIALRNSQIAESKYITDQAEALYDSHDYVSAVELYLNALPSTENERPVVPQTLYDLTKALGLYTNHLYDPEMAPFKSNYRVDLPDTISTEFIVDQTGDYIFAFDNHNIYIYSTESNYVTLMITFEFGDTVKHIEYNENEHQIYVVTPFNLFSFDSLSGTQLWRVNTSDEIQQFLMNDNKEDLVLVTDKAVTVVNTNGKVKERRFIELPENVSVSNEEELATLLLDNNTVIFIGIEDETNQILYRYDIHNDVLEEFKRFDIDTEIKIGVYDASSYYVLYTNDVGTITLSKYIVDQYSPVWNVDLDEVMLFVSTEQFTVDSGKQGIFCTLGRTVFVMDADTGELRGLYESTEANIAKVVMLGNKLHVLAKDGLFKYIELDGNLNFISSEYLRSVDCNQIDDIVYAAKDGYEQCFVQIGNIIYQYDTLIEEDPNLISTGITVDTIDFSILKDDINVVLSGNEVQFKVKDETVQNFILPEDCIPRRLVFADENEIGVLIQNENSYEHYLYQYTIKSKSFTLTNVEECFGKMNSYVDGEYVYSISVNGSLMLDVTNLLTKTTKSYELSDKPASAVYGTVYAENGLVYYLDEYNLELIIFDIDKNKTFQVIDLGEWTRAAICSLKDNLGVICVNTEKHRIAVPNQEYVFIYDKYGRRILEIPYKNENDHVAVVLPYTYISSDKNCAYVFSKDEVLRVSLKDHTFQRENVDFDFSLEENQKMTFMENDTYINVLSGKNLLMLMDSELFGKAGYVEQVEEVDEINNRIYVCSNKGLEYYKFYSFDEMLKMGQERIEGKMATW